MQLTKQEISDLTLSCETLMAQLYDDIKPIESHFDDDIDNIELRDGIKEELIDIRRFIDSRCDKLDNKIQTLTPAGESDKPLIKG